MVYNNVIHKPVFWSTSMPPQVKVSKEHIKSEAFQMTKESGFEAVSARKLAERLN